MGSTDSDEVATTISTNVTPREAIIDTAIKFLQNPNVMRSPVNQKQQFLRTKGLTETEIQIACERAGVFTIDPTSGQQSTVINMGHYPKNVYVQPEMTILARIKDTLSSIALVSGLAYAVYLFYKRFIEPLLFGRKKRKTLDEKITEMDKKIETNIQQLKEDVNKYRDDINRATDNDDTIRRDITAFKNDIEAIKGLLLNRKQFATPLSTQQMSIPAWQLTSQTLQQQQQQHQQQQDDDHLLHHLRINRHNVVDVETETDDKNNDDAGSGSGSSETEVVTKNSDSSLEIM